MHRSSLQPPLLPKNGAVLKVLTIDRISTVNQDPKSNEDQLAFNQQWVKDRYDGPIEWFRITGQGSGENLDREQVRNAEELVDSGEIDLVVMEDLSRHMRRMHANLFCELCVDKETRLVAINDHIDTAGEWQLHALFATIKSEQYNRDTSLRIKRSQRNRFMQGEMIQHVIYGYIKPRGAKTDAELSKDPDAEPIYDAWFNKLEDGATYSEIADWLNAQAVPTGPQSRRDKWDCKMVARVTHTPILKGVRVRNNMKSKRINSTGKYVSVKAEPDELLERQCEHLAFIEPERYDRVLAMVDARNAKYRAAKNGNDPRKGRPKKRTVWPGQHLTCGVCGRLLRYGGHGQNHRLLCGGAYDYKCWNGITVDGPLAAQKMTAAVFDAISNLPGFDEELIEAVAQDAARSNTERQRELRRLNAKVDENTRYIDNMLKVIRNGSSNIPDSMMHEMKRLEDERARFQLAVERLQQRASPSLELPDIEALKQMARELLQSAVIESPEFGRVMHRLIPTIEIVPVRLCDGGKIQPRAHFRLTLASLLPDADRTAALESALSYEMGVDLFDPPQRERHREQVVAMRGDGLKEREIAKRLGVTQPAVQNAAALQRKMDQLGLESPYLQVDEPPEDCTKLRRHHHPRYRFEPLESTK